MKENDWREEFLKDYVKGKRVLDLGPGDIQYRSLHGWLSEQASEILGVEIDAERVQALKKKGFSVKQGDATTFRAGQGFDCVIAGDLIEHVENPGNLIENAMRHLKKGSVFVFNTPNIHSINMLLRGLVLGKVDVFPEHTVGFTEQLLVQLLDRYGLEPERTIYFSHPNPNLKSIIIRALSRIRPSWHENILMVIRK